LWPYFAGRAIREREIEAYLLCPSGAWTPAIVKTIRQRAGKRKTSLISDMLFHHFRSRSAAEMAGKGFALVCAAQGV